MTKGQGGDPAELRDLPRNVHVEWWVAQEHVLSHADAVVGHGGFGTTLAALAHGVPLVMLPLFASDQWQMAHRVAQFGGGVALPESPQPGRRAHDAPGDDVIHALPHAVRRILEDPAHKSAARALSAAVAALPPVDTAVDLFDDLSSKGIRGIQPDPPYPGTPAIRRVGTIGSARG